MELYRTSYDHQDGQHAEIIHNLVITAPAVHNVYSRIISSSVVTTAPLESAFSIAMMPAW